MVDEVAPALTIEQQRALAMARARQRLDQQFKASREQLFGEGVDPEPPISFGEDLGKTIAGKSIQGVVDLPGVVGDIDQTLAVVGGKIGDVIKRGTAYWNGEEMPPWSEPPERLLKGIAPTSPEWEEFVGFKPYEPAYAANKIIGEGLRMAPSGAVGGGVAAALRGGNVPAAMMSGAGEYGMIPGLTSEAAGVAAEKTGVVDPSVARIAGAIVGGVGAPNLVRRVVTPRRIPPENARMADALRREGVTGLTEGQVTQSPRRLAKERTLPGDRMKIIQDEQGEQFTRAILRRVGEDAPRATTEVVDRAYRRIGGEFDRLTANNSLLPDTQFANDLGDTVRWYADRVAQPNRAPIIERYVREIGERVRQGGGQMSGEAYQSLRSRIAADARGMGDPYTASTLRDLTDDLDDAMERSIAATNPADAGAFAEARRQYRNMLVIEKAATGAGSDAALGLISPSAFRNAVTTAQGRRAYARGQGDFAELARAGEALLRPLPLTGVAPIRTALDAMGFPFNLMKMVPRGIEHLRMSPLGRRYMTNTALPQRPLNPVAAALAQGAQVGRLTGPADTR